MNSVAASSKFVWPISRISCRSPLVVDHSQTEVRRSRPREDHSQLIRRSQTIITCSFCKVVYVSLGQSAEFVAVVYLLSAIAGQKSAVANKRQTIANSFAIA